MRVGGKLYIVLHSFHFNSIFLTFPTDCHMRLLLWLLLFIEMVPVLTLLTLLESFLLLKRNKYVGILSIAVTTLQYITISMITIFSMYIAHVR